MPLRVKAAPAESGIAGLPAWRGAANGLHEVRVPTLEELSAKPGSSVVCGASSLSVTTAVPLSASSRVTVAGVVSLDGARGSIDAQGLPKVLGSAVCR